MKERLSVSACLIGFARDTDMYLYLDDEERMYSNDIDSIYLVGRGINQALETLVNGKEQEILLE